MDIEKIIISFILAQKTIRKYLLLLIAIAAGFLFFHNLREGKSLKDAVRGTMEVIEKTLTGKQKEDFNYSPKRVVAYYRAPVKVVVTGTTLFCLYKFFNPALGLTTYALPVLLVGFAILESVWLFIDWLLPHQEMKKSTTWTTRLFGEKEKKPTWASSAYWWTSTILWYGTCAALLVSFVYYAYQDAQLWNKGIKLGQTQQAIDQIRKRYRNMQTQTIRTGGTKRKLLKPPVQATTHWGQRGMHDPNYDFRARYYDVNLAGKNSSIAKTEVTSL